MRDLWERHSFNDKPQASAVENFAYAYGSPLNDHSPILDSSFKTNRELHIYSARPGLRDVLLSEPQGDSSGLCIRSAPAASALPLTKPQI